MNRVILNAGALAFGVAVGLALAWYVFPVRYVDTAPGTLRPADRALALDLIAEAYLSEQDVARALERALALGEADPAQTFTARAQQARAANAPETRVRALGALALALGQRPGVAVVSPTARPTLTPAPPTPTPPPPATITAPPPTAPPPTPVMAFALAEVQTVCDPAQAGRIQVVTQDRVGNPVSAVAVQVTWDNGQTSDRFFTGLKPEFGLGYGDFDAQPGVTYTVRLLTPQPATLAEVSLPACGAFTGAVRVIARQP